MDRPKWMPDETVILEIQDGEYIDGEVDDAFRRTGLRAQIAVLEDLCHHAIPMKHSNAYPVDAAPKALLLDIIAAIRKELEG